MDESFRAGKKAQKNPRSPGASRGALRGPSRQGPGLGPGVFCRGFACCWRFAWTGSAGVHTRGLDTRSLAQHMVYSEPNAVKNWPPWMRDWHRLVQLTAKKGSFTRKKAQKNTRSARASRGALREPSRQGAALGPGVFSRGFADFWRFACTGSAGVHSSLNHVTDLPDAVLKWTLCTQKVRWKKKNFSRKASIRRKHPDFSFKVPRCP